MPKVKAKIIKYLVEADLSESEIMIYLQLLEKPARTKWELVQRTGLNRNTVYRGLDHLASLRMIVRKNGYYKSASLSGLVSHLKNAGSKLNRSAYKIQKLAPFLRMPHETVEDINTLFTLDDITESYLFMANQPYSTNLDFGDFENFIKTLGGVPMACKFRNIRSRHARNLALCTTSGPITDYFSTPEQKKNFQTNLRQLNIHAYEGKFTIFSDTSDYVLFNDFQHIENQSSVLVKSRTIAENQRALFHVFSQNFEKR